MSTKVLFVDWDGTLSHSKFWQNCRHPSLSPTALEACKALLFSSSNDLLRNWMKGFLTSSQVMDQVARHCHLNAEALHQELERSCRAMQFADSTIPVQIQRIRKRGIKVVIATDNMDTFSKWTVPELGLNRLFDDILNSADCSAFKAEIVEGRSPFFHQYLVQHQTQTHEAILLDDSINNAVVQSLGMHFLHISPERPLSQALETFL